MHREAYQRPWMLVAVLLLGSGVGWSDDRLQPTAKPDAATTGEFAFASIIDGKRGISLWNSGHPTLLTNDFAQAVDPAWSPDGKRLAFAAWTEAELWLTRNDADIYVLELESGKSTRLTRDEAQDDYPKWSPDGESIAFMSDRTGAHEIYIMRTDGTGVRRFLPDFDHTAWPAWSPDGKTLAFTALHDPDTPQFLDSGRLNSLAYARDIYLAAPDGTGLRKVTDDAAIESYPTWSPDGERLAYSANSPDNPGDLGTLQLHVVDVDGSSPTRVTQQAGQNVRPDWSPDGSRLIFHFVAAPPAPQNGASELYTVRPDGTERIRVTDNTWDDFSAVWRPEGR